MLVWLLLQTDESCRQGMEKGSERKKRAQCDAVVDCGSSEGGKSSEGLEKQLSSDSAPLSPSTLAFLVILAIPTNITAPGTEGDDWEAERTSQWRYLWIYG
ncbi:hypothetical protein ROHU_026567 [Labeo rohita]|uniref:Uncharacterized protein n=1 Tax=Labeo rohita TaxID=84645 RepID=A0A498MBU3_LABRO|nr:hypothetical protein ROHU_026567 [Labeo rohita]